MNLEVLGHELQFAQVFIFCFFLGGVIIIRIRKTLLESEVIKLVLHEVDSPKFARQ